MKKNKSTVELVKKEKDEDGQILAIDEKNSYSNNGRRKRSS